MKKISLTQNLYALVDDDMFEYLNQWKWHAQKSGRSLYAARHEGKRPFRKYVRMHNYVIDTPDGLEIDHWDGNGLNNQRQNLRVCTHKNNTKNKGKQSNNTSGFKGVYLGKKKWYAQIAVNGHSIHLGSFDSSTDAALAYDSAAKEYHGEFARLNFPDGKTI